jgi:putative inorganic carbon (HCO3(-)) transporter
MLRKCLLALATAVLVARPLVIGEDPGMLARDADPAGLALLLLWLGGLAAWAGWRLWSGQSELRGGLVDLALLGVVVCLFVSGEVAATYKHPARLIAWHWLGFLTVYFLVRQLAVTAEERHGLYTALLASAVMLSAYAVYQYVEEMPLMREKFGHDPNLSPSFRRRILEDNVYSTFAHPNSYAGYMALLVPGLIGAAWALRRARWWMAGLAFACALVGCFALWLTHSRGALLGLAAAGALTGVVLGRHWLWRHRGAALAGVVVLAGLAFLVWRGGLLTKATGKGSGTMAVRLEYWRTTWKMIEDRPVLGFGPGNFGGAYPRYMDESAVEKIKDPHNFALEMLVLAGPVALLLLLVALAAALVPAFRAWAAPPKEEVTPPQTAREPVRWEFYVGGMIGLVLGFLLGAGERLTNPDEVFIQGFLACFRSVVWFVSFAVLERVRWTERGRAIALTTGVVALLLNLCVSGGILYETIAVPLWACLALAVNTASTRPVPWLSRRGLAVVLPAPALLVLLLLYAGYVFYPVGSAYTTARKALVFGDVILKDARQKPEERFLKSEKEQKRQLSYVVEDLQKAEGLDPQNANILLNWSAFSAEQYRLFPPELSAKPVLRMPVMSMIDRAGKLDPEDTDVYAIPYRLYREHADLLLQEAAKDKNKKSAEYLRAGAAREYARAAQTLEPVLQYDPTEARWHALLAEAYHAADEKKYRTEWEVHAREARRLDAIQRKQSMQPARTLEDAQRDRLYNWLEEVAKAKT